MLKWRRSRMRHRTLVCPGRYRIRPVYIYEDGSPEYSVYATSLAANDFVGRAGTQLEAKALAQRHWNEGRHPMQDRGR